MIKVYYMKVFPFLEEDTFCACLNKIETKRKEKILRISGEEEKGRSLAAGCLLHYGLCRELDLSPADTKAFLIDYGAEGKPFLMEYPEIHFNLSHSGEYVCCAFAREPIGADIQKITAVKKGIAERFFTEEDNKRLLKCRDGEREELFFRMWSIKESYIKLTGKGIGRGLDSFEINWQKRAIYEKYKENEAAFFEEKRDFYGYSFCVCFKRPDEEIRWEEIDFREACV